MDCGTSGGNRNGQCCKINLKSPSKMTTSKGLTHCPTMGTPYLYADNQESKVRRIIKTRCKLWTCPYCAEINAIGHYIRILNGLNELQQKKQTINFVTLTSHEKIRTFEQGYRVWQSAWRKLQERVRRRLKNSDTDCQFVYLFESHKKGGLHVHMLVCGGLQTRWWKDNARECGLGYQAKSEQVDNAGLAASYVVKYIAKNIGLEVPIKGFRRINYSRGFPTAPKIESPDRWTIIPKSESITSVIEQAWYSLGFDVTLHGQYIDELID